jgi:hypothetical protein
MDDKQKTSRLGIVVSVVAWLSVIACLVYLQYLKGS